MPVRDSDFGIPSALGLRISDFTLWQLTDSAFPTGGFAHAGGLEAAWQNGEVRNRTELREWLTASLRQVSRASLPFVNAAYANPEQLAELDQVCDAFTSNHVANRASRLQGRAFLAAVKRIFAKRGLEADSTPHSKITLMRPEGRVPAVPFAHLAPVHGACLRQLGVPVAMAVRLFIFTHLRGLIAAAVRLNIIGPMEGQSIQFELSGEAESAAEQGARLALEDLAQTAPLLDLWQSTQDRLYSRLFQS